MELLLGGTLTNQLLTPIINLQKRVLRINTFSNYNDHSNPLFEALEIIKFEDIIFLHNAIFMYDFHSGTLPPAFANYFTAVNKRQTVLLIYNNFLFFLFPIFNP